MDPEQQDQQRCHERAAAHARHADQETDGESRNRIKRINELHGTESQTPVRGKSRIDVRLAS